MADESQGNQGGGQEVDEAKESEEGVSFLYDLPVTLHVTLGETTLSIREILKCGKGSVIRLNQKVGDPFLVTLHKHPLAEGEVVETGDHLGIKITNILRSINASSIEGAGNEG